VAKGEPVEPEPEEDAAVNYITKIMQDRLWESLVGDIPNRYTSDVVLNQQARVAHQGWYGGFAIPGSPVAEVATAVLDAGAYGGSLDMPMADY
jgi:hypothetical protein